MTFTLTIDCDNAAFEDNLKGEVARILVNLVESRIAWDDTEGNLRDAGGNTVGSWSFADTGDAS